ncbi:hypothetical protein ABTD43_19880, partial [Acinetobacter baumannii]
MPKDADDCNGPVTLFSRHRDLVDFSGHFLGAIGAPKARKVSCRGPARHATQHLHSMAALASRARLVVYCCAWS